MSSTTYTGGCNCGAVRYESAAEPLMMGHCQCRDCQYESGGGHASQIAFPRAAVKVEGKVTQWDKRADSGNMVTRAILPDVRVTRLFRELWYARPVLCASGQPRRSQRLCAPNGRVHVQRFRLGLPGSGVA